MMKPPARAHLTTALAFAIGVFAIAGCGGGASGSSASHGSASTTSVGASTGGSTIHGAPLSAGELLIRADAICRRLNTELAATKGKGVSARQIVLSVPRNIALESGSLEELAKLVPPSSRVRGWRRLLAERTKLAEELTLLLKAAKRNDAAAMTTLITSKKRSHAALLKIATSLGFKDCSTVG
jgi:hypothetical protein